MRIAFPSEYDPDDVTALSGIPFYMSAAFERCGAEVDRIHLQRPLHLLAEGIATKLFYRAARHQTYIARRSRRHVSAYGRQLGRSLRNSPYDVVLATGPLAVALADTDVPVVIWSDTTVRGLLDYYPQFTNLAPPTVRDNDFVEQAALERCTLAIFSNEWAAATALKSYRLPEHKVEVVPFGANVDGLCEEGVSEAIRSRRGRTCRLLFNGVNWSIKGGAKAVRVAELLNEAGISCELTVVGVDAATVGIDHEWLTIVGYVDKRTPSGRELIAKLHARSHFLVLPVAIDTCPIALAEANAFAVPVVTSHTSGIPTVVRDGVNGRMFVLEAPPEALANYVASTFRDVVAYERLARSAYDEYRRRLNWDVSAQEVLRLIGERIGGRA